MSDPTPTQTRFHGIPGIVAVWLLVALIGAAVAYELGVKPSYLISIGVALIVGATGAMLSSTLQDLGRRQPRLALAAAEADRSDPTRVTAPHLPPWPVDARRVVANEIAEAEASLEIDRSSLLLSVMGAGLLTSRPSTKDHERARERFTESLPQHADALREWLAGYAEAATVRSQTFELTLRLANSSPSVHADDVTVVLDLPPSVVQTDEVPACEPPPERPSYEPPQPQLLYGMGYDRPYVSRAAIVGSLFPKVPPIDLPEAAWQASANGRRLEASAGEVHAQRSVVVCSPLLLRARGSGRHEICWRAYTKSARRASEGVLTLVVLADDSGRPAFGRMKGVTSYPDVDLVDADSGDVVAAARTSDPPPRPPDFDRLKESHALMQWHALGLDPSCDGTTTAGAVRRIPGHD